MAAYKYSLIFQYVSGAATGNWSHIPGGWSESVYALDAADNTKALFQRLAQARCLILPQFCQVVGLRFQQVDPTGSSSTKKVFFTGTTGTGTEQDIPQAAALISIPATGFTNIRRYRAAALPDNAVIRGEWSPDSFYRANMTAFLRALNGWRFRGADLTQPVKLIDTIAGDGSVVLLEDLALAVGDVVSIRSSVAADGRKFSGKFKVASVTDTKHFKILKWKGGSTTVGGCRKFVPVYPPMLTTGIDQNAIDIVVRKVGRPSKRYVGRRSKRR